MKIYLAAPWSEMETMQLWAAVLRDHGHECTARWITVDPDAPQASDYVQKAKDYAQKDLDDIDRAEVVIHYTLPHGTMFSSGGRHVELGYALAKHKMNIIVGDGDENVFHHLPQIVVVGSINDAMRVLHNRRMPMR